MRQISYVFLALAVLATNAYGSDLSEYLPEKAGPLHRIQLITGDAAQQEVDELHGKQLPAEASAVARYSMTESGGRPAEVWISRVSSEKEARRQTGQMVHMMYENPNSPFKDPKRLEINGLSVYRFVGMGQAHLVWFKADLVYWISVAPAQQKIMADVFCQ